MKQIELNTEKWKGHVILHDPIPLVKLAIFEEAVTEALAIDSKLAKAKSHVAILPALMECVAEWRIDGFPNSVTPETFPGAGSEFSKVDIATLINLIVDRILKLYQGKDPNA